MINDCFGYKLFSSCLFCLFKEFGRLWFFVVFFCIDDCLIICEDCVYFHHPNSHARGRKFFSLAIQLISTKGNGYIAFIFVGGCKGPLNYFSILPNLSPLGHVISSLNRL